jgi:hypothetical protein
MPNLPLFFDNLALSPKNHRPSLAIITADTITLNLNCKTKEGVQPKKYLTNHSQVQVTGCFCSLKPSIHPKFPQSLVVVSNEARNFRNMKCSS